MTNDTTPTCRSCGCTADHACWPTCTWHEPDLCSQCSDRVVHTIAPALEQLAVPMRSLVPHPQRDRIRDQRAEEAMRESLALTGQYRPVIARTVTVDGEVLAQVLAGHGIVEQAAWLCWNHVAVVIHEVDDETAARIVAIDNRSADLGSYDRRMTQELLELLPDLSGTGYLPEDLAEIVALNELDAGRAALTDVDDVPALEVVPISRAGDVWLLGPHRLVVGDARWMDTLDEALGRVDVGDDIGDRRLADVLLTDPPYNVAYEGSDGKTIENDDLAAAEFEQFIGEILWQAAAHLRVGAPAYVFHADSEGVAFREAFTGAGLLLKQVLIWVKDQFVLGRQDHQWQHEPILYGWKAGGPHSWYGGRTLTTVLDDERDAGEWSKAELVELLRALRSECSTVIRADRPRRNDEHPTMKPVDLLMQLIERSTRAGQLVLDVCAGSGSTLIACHHTGRVAALVESDEKYADVICRRWEQHTGEVPRRPDGSVVSFLEAELVDGGAR